MTDNHRHAGPHFPACRQPNLHLFAQIIVVGSFGLTPREVVMKVAISSDYLFGIDLCARAQIVEGRNTHKNLKGSLERMSRPRCIRI